MLGTVVVGTLEHLQDSRLVPPNLVYPVLGKNTQIGKIWTFGNTLYKVCVKFMQDLACFLCLRHNLIFKLDCDAQL